MILACEINEGPASLEPTHLALLAFALIAPLVVFVLLPKRLPFRQELRFALAGALRPLAWLASLVEGKRHEASTWGPRLRRAAREMAERAHPGGPSGEVVRDDRLLGRAYAVGLVAAAVPVLGAAMLTLVMIKSESNPPLMILKFVTSSLLAVMVASWLAWLGGVAGAIWAQALAIGGGAFGRGGPGRALGGALVGAGYGAFTGISAGVMAFALFVPAMTLLTGDAPPLRELSSMFGFTGAATAVLGAPVGVLVLTPLAIKARRAAITR